MSTKILSRQSDSITFASNRDYVVRIVYPIYRGQTKQIQAWLQKLENKVPVEEIITVVTIRHIEIMITRYIDGDPGHMRMIKELGPQLNDILQIIRKITINSPQSVKQYMNKKTEEFLQRAKKEIQGRNLSLYSQCDYSPYRMVLSNNDLHPMNVIVRNKKIVGIIDWECAGYYPEFWEPIRMSACPFPGVEEFSYPPEVVQIEKCLLLLDCNLKNEVLNKESHNILNS